MSSVRARPRRDAHKDTTLGRNPHGSCTRRQLRSKLRSARQQWLPAFAIFFLLATAMPLMLWGRSGSGVGAGRTTSPAVDGTSLLVTSRAGGYKEDYCTRLENSEGELQPAKNFLRSENKAWLALLIPGVIFLFIGLAIVTDEYFVPSLERICERLNLSEDVAGATFMAAGSSAPELFTSLLGALWTKDDVGIGTIVGSAVFNILIIIGLSAALAKEPLDLDWRPLIRDSTFYVGSIAMLIVFVMWVGGYKDPNTGDFNVAGYVQWWEGLILVIAYIFYVLFLAYLNKPYFEWASKRAHRFKRNNSHELTEDVEDVEDANGNATSAEQQDVEPLGLVDASPSPPSPPPNSQPNQNLSPNQNPNQQSQPTTPIPPETQSILERHTSRYFERNPRSHMRVLTYAIIAANSLATNSDAENNNQGAREEERQSCLGVKKPKTLFQWLTLPFFAPWQLLYHFTIIDCAKERLAKYWLATFLVSIIWIMIISFGMVEATRLAGCYIGIPSAVMGLTFLAAGTSVPDALASVSVARNGFGNMAVSNAIGSNVFDILLGLGLPWFLAGLINTPRTTIITVSPITRIVIPICILFGVIVLLVGILIVLKWKLSKMLGYILFGLYAAFVVWSLLEVFVLFPET